MSFFIPLRFASFNGSCAMTVWFNNFLPRSQVLLAKKYHTANYATSKPIQSKQFLARSSPKTKETKPNKVNIPPCVRFSFLVTVKMTEISNNLETAVVNHCLKILLSSNVIQVPICYLNGMRFIGVKQEIRLARRSMCGVCPHQYCRGRFVHP